jgi:uncharacterized protein (DUF1015 family)
MAVFRPFRGCRYVPQVAGSLDDLLCPPYDMIGPALKQSLQGLSPYNAVHLEGGEQPDPVNPEASYHRAASLFRQWLENGALRQEDVPCFYLMRHTYQDQGETKQQSGLFGNILVEEYGHGSVLPHEFTREPAVLDRVALLEASMTQFSPLMTLYRDASNDLAPIMEQITAAAPDLQSSGNPMCNIGQVALWRITDPGLQGQITAFFEERPVFLADGHHRYEAALRYRRSRPESSSDAASNYVMMSLTEFDDAGLQLLPYHKVIGGLSPEQLERLEASILELFDSRPIDLAQCGGQGLGRMVIEEGQSRHVVGLVGPGPDRARLLTLRDGIAWRQWGELAVSEAWLLDEQVIKPSLGDDALRRHVDYSHDAELTTGMVTGGTQQMAFLLKPFPMDAFESIVGGGQRLPSKSTFFYPKLPTGLVINRLDGTV